MAVISRQHPGMGSSSPVCLVAGRGGRLRFSPLPGGAGCQALGTVSLRRRGCPCVCKVVTAAQPLLCSSSPAPAARGVVVFKEDEEAFDLPNTK